MNEFQGGIYLSLDIMLSKEVDKLSLEHWVDCAIAAKHLGKSPEWVRANLKVLGIPHLRLGRHYRFKISQIEIWMIENQETTTTKAEKNGRFI